MYALIYVGKADAKEGNRSSSSRIALMARNITSGSQHIASDIMTAAVYLNSPLPNPYKIPPGIEGVLTGGAGVVRMMSKAPAAFPLGQKRR
ncbi:hypothetical protein IFU00_14845 [Oxalobacteraceae sp. CFBP 8761]|jgi:hypothetical protein|nr:hypothetical protein [Oxalobacteraceae sp. CFBP 8761]